MTIYTYFDSLSAGRSRIVVERDELAGRITLTRDDKRCFLSLVTGDVNDAGALLDGDGMLWLAERIREAARGLPWTETPYPGTELLHRERR